MLLTCVRLIQQAKPVNLLVTVIIALIVAAMVALVFYFRFIRKKKKNVACPHCSSCPACSENCSSRMNEVRK